MTKQSRDELMAELHRLSVEQWLMNKKRVALAVEMWNSEEFRKGSGSEEVRLAIIQDDLGNDMCLDFLSLKKIFDVMPDDERWLSGRYQEMLKDVEEQERKQM